MSKIIQQVPLGDKESLYMTERKTHPSERGWVVHFFHQNYLVKFLKENEIWTD